MDVNELTERYQAGERDFRNLDLVMAHLEGINLSEANLRDCDLREANLTGAI